MRVHSVTAVHRDQQGQFAEAQPKVSLEPEIPRTPTTILGDNHALREQVSELKQQVLTKPVEKIVEVEEIVERIVEGPVGAMKTEEEFLEEAQVKQEKRGREGERETYTVEEGDKEANQQKVGGWGGRERSLLTIK